MREINMILKKLRKAKGITQEQLAEQLGVSLMTVRRWEWGNTSPNTSMLRKMADVFGVTPEELIMGEVDEVKLSLMREPDKRGLHNMAYWGSVVDNARNVAENGNDEDIEDVSQMLKRALASLVRVPTGREATSVVMA